MLRRGVGVQAVKQREQQLEKFKTVSNQLEETQLQHFQAAFTTFHTHLTNFVSLHSKEILKNPSFRHHFLDMCRKINVDPLAAHRGWWSAIGLGDFYYTLAIRILEICIQTRPNNGGIIEMKQLKELLNRKYQTTGNNSIKAHDIRSALSKLNVFGPNIQIIKLKSNPTISTNSNSSSSSSSSSSSGGGSGGSGNEQGELVVTLPKEMNVDFEYVIQKAKVNGRVCVSELIQQDKWTLERCHSAIDMLLQEGMMWVDQQAKEHAYYIPNFGND